MRAQEFLSEARIPDEIEDFLYDLTPDDVGVEEFGPYRVHYEGFTDDCQSSSDYCANPEAVYQQVFADHIAREGGRRPIEQNFTGDEDYPILYSIFKIPRRVKENFADGKVKGKSRPGRVKKAGASCKGSVSSLRAKARKYGGERGKMYHWCANMKGGKKNESAVDEGWKQNVAAGVLGAGMALGSGAAQADNDVFNKKFSPTEIQQIQSKADLTQRYYNELVRRAKEDGRIMDRTTLNVLKAQAEDAAARSVQQKPQAPQAKSALPGAQPSELRRSSMYKNFESTKK